MKYTRYNVRKSSNESFFFVLIVIMILILAYIIGSIISKAFFTRTSVSIKNEPGSKIASGTGSEDKQEKFTNYIVVHGGVFDSKDNAEALRTKLQTEYGPFVSEENGKYDVIIGIYTDSAKSDAALKALNGEKIDAKGVTYKIDVNDMCNAEIIGIINGGLEIISKLGEKNVQAVQTGEFKKWSASLKEVDKNSINISALNDVKNYIGSMPNEVSKGNIPEMNKAIFTAINKAAAKTVK